MLEKIGQLIGRMRAGAARVMDDTRSPSLPADDRHDFTQELKNPKEVGQFVTNLHDEWAEARMQYEPEWYLNLAYYIGQQWAVWDRASRSVIEPKAPSYRVRFTANRILPTHRTLMGKLNRGAHIGQAVPIQQTETAFSDARIAERVLRALHESLGITEVNFEFYCWLLTTGTAFFKVGWDPTVGQPIYLPDGTMVRAGEACVDALGPFDLLFPPDIKAPLNKPFRFMHCAVFDVETLRATYPETARGLAPDDHDSSNPFLERVKALVTPIAPDTSGGSGREKGSGVYVAELWEDPELLNPKDAEMFPNGRVSVVALQKKIVLSQHENPYESPFPTGSKNPIAMCRDDVMPGRFYGMSRVSQLAPVQHNYNRGRSQMIEARNLCTQPKINVEKGHGIAKITNEPGQILERNRGVAPPAYMAPPAMSEYMVRDVLDTLSEFQELSQIAEVSRGQSPAANTSGIAIDMLQEADNTPLGPLATNIASAMSRSQTMLYKRVQQFYDEERVMSYVGENNEDDVFVFLADRNPTALRIQVTPESVFPESQAAKRLKTEKAVEMGVLVPGKDRVTILREMRFGSVDTVFENADLDRQKANRENRGMLEGVPAKVETFHDHEIHIYQHDRLRKSPEWDRLAPEVQAMVSAHVEEHLAFLATVVQANAQMGASPMPGEAPEDAEAVSGAPEMAAAMPPGEGMIGG